MIPSASDSVLPGREDHVRRGALQDELQGGAQQSAAGGKEAARVPLLISSVSY